jgi:glycosyltransferase involved in cell wall biosynthesis
MKIAHIIPAVTIGGLWRHLEAISHLDEERFDSLVVSIFDRDVPELVDRLELPVVRLKMDPEAYMNLDLIQAEVRYALEDFGPSIIHSYHLYSDIYSLPSVNLLRCVGIRAIHGITQVPFSNPFSRREIRVDWPVEDLARMKMLDQFCSLTLTVSRDLKNKLVRHGFGSSTIKVVYPGINLDMFSLRESRSPSRENVVIGFLGRLEPVKNPSLFLCIARECFERGFAGQFWLIGDGRLSSSIRDEIERLGLSERVVMKPETIDVEPLVRELDILLVTSFSEGLPLSVLEAMAVGVPVIASNVGGVPEVIISGRTGFLCSVDRSGEFVDRIFELVSDSDLSRWVTVQARQLIERKFALGKYLGRMGKVYKMLG